MSVGQDEQHSRGFVVLVALLSAGQARSFYWVVLQNRFFLWGVIANVMAVSLFHYAAGYLVSMYTFSCKGGTREKVM